MNSTSEPKSNQTILDRITMRDGMESFYANEEGIIALKDEFRQEAFEFLCLRKGEDIGAAIIAYNELLTNIILDPALFELAKHELKRLLNSDASQIVVRAGSLAWASYYGIKLYGLVEERIRKEAENEAKRAMARGMTRKPTRLHLLCYPDSENEAARPLYEIQGYEVRHYRSASLKGVYRFYLNEKRYAFFIRTETGFHGTIGSDRATREALMSLFEKEWKESVRPPGKSSTGRFKWF